MRKTSLVVSTTLTALLAFASGPALAVSVSIDDVNDSYVSTNLPDVPNAGERVENDADGNALLIELYSSTLHDPTATATDKAVAGQELAKLGIASSKDSATAPGVSPAAACPVSVGDPTQVASAGSAAAAACETVTPPPHEQDADCHLGAAEQRVLLRSSIGPHGDQTKRHLNKQRWCIQGAHPS